MNMWILGGFEYLYMTAPSPPMKFFIHMSLAKCIKDEPFLCVVTTGYTVQLIMIEIVTKSLSTVS